MSAADRIWRTCGICEHDYAADMVSRSSAEANGIGDTTACMACLSFSTADIAQAAREAVTVCDYPAEMQPHYCPAGCAADDADSHEHGCERFCRTHMTEVGEDGCSACREDDRFDEQSPRRPSANRWAVLS